MDSALSATATRNGDLLLALGRDANFSEVRYPLGASDQALVDYVITFKHSMWGDPSPTNFLRVFPGFLILMPTWLGLGWEYHVDTHIEIRHGPTERPVATIERHDLYDLRHTSGGYAGAIYGSLLLTYGASALIPGVVSCFDVLDSDDELHTCEAGLTADQRHFYAASVVAAVSKTIAEDLRRNPQTVIQPHASKPEPPGPDVPARSPPAAEPSVTLPVAGQGPRAAERTFVLVVGCNGYADRKIPDLRFAENDARDVFAFYATDTRSPTERDRVQIVSGREATRVAVLKAIREHLIEKATEPTDSAVLYFAGHGFSDADETYLACADTQLESLMETAIPLSTLQGYWNRIGAGTKLLMTDACHSGGLANLRGLTVRRNVVGAGASRVSAVIAAAGANEVSAEDEGLGKGVFTTVLLNGLRGNADLDRSGAVSLDELKRFLEEAVPPRAREVGGKQTPVIEIHGPARSVALTR